MTVGKLGQRTLDFKWVFLNLEFLFEILCP